jgi:hypothetical protein
MVSLVNGDEGDRCSGLERRGFPAAKSPKHASALAF